MRLTQLAIALTLAAPAALAPVAATAQTAPAPAAATPYTSNTTEIGTLLDDAAAKEVLNKHIPQVVANPQIEMARGMTLKAVQAYAPDVITDAVLAAIDVDLAKLPAKK